MTTASCSPHCPAEHSTLKAEQHHADLKRRWWIIERDFERRRQRKRGSRPSIATLRVCELNRLFHTRYRGSLLPDDDDGRDSIQIMVNHLAMLADPSLRIADWLRRCAPWFSESEAEPLIEAAIKRPRRWKADTLAKRLNLTDAERSRLKIKTVGAVDCTKEQRAKRRCEKDRLDKEAKRRAAGAKPQSKSINRTKPWEQEVISRSTWYRRKRVTQLRPQYEAGSVTADEPVSFSLSAASEAAQTAGLSQAVQQPLLGQPSYSASASCGPSKLPSRAATTPDWRLHSAESWAQIMQLKADICLAFTVAIRRQACLEASDVERAQMKRS